MSEADPDNMQRFEITYDADVGMVHRPHPNGYYVRWQEAATTISALVAERDEALKRMNAAVEDYNDALAESKTATDARIAMVFELAEAREYLAEARADVERLRKALEWAGLRPDDFAALKGGEDA